ncbi:Uncharacterized protein K02A2.6 [Stylophora pistillata]|uniref:Uncharacterized protein K02A2.6 n=1 Tax=Stylophora pistillata TaxID=50429 RepID=A0A2B4SBQ1_STYPI|nr:Uncharacterized protein K02A2.6 [Stylophora pistillata]
MGWPTEREEVPVHIREFWTYRDEMTLHNGVLLKNQRLIIPKTLRTEVTSRIHSSHLGIEACLRKARDLVFWPSMNAEIKEAVTNCSICAGFQEKQRKQPMQSHEIPDHPWSRLSSDLFTLHNKEYVVLVDSYSDCVEVLQLKITTSTALIEFYKEQFSRHGIPDILMTDNGPRYTSREFTEFTREWEFKHLTSSPYHARSNGFKWVFYGTVGQYSRYCGFARANRWGISVSHSSTLNKLDEMGNSFDATIKMWKHEMERDHVLHEMLSKVEEYVDEQVAINQVLIPDGFQTVNVSDVDISFVKSDTLPEHPIEDVQSIDSDLVDIEDFLDDYVSFCHEANMNVDQSDCPITDHLFACGFSEDDIHAFKDSVSPTIPVFDAMDKLDVDRLKYLYDVNKAKRYQIIGHNLDMYIKAHHMGNDSQNRSIHWFATNAIQDRVTFTSSTSIINQRKLNLELSRQKAKRYFEKTAKTLPKLDVGQDVQVAGQRKKTWQPGKCLEKLSNRSYLQVQIDRETVRWNREDLRPKLDADQATSIAPSLTLEEAKFTR